MSNAGGSTPYYKLPIDTPLTLEDSYVCECLDIIVALGMDFAEGEAFKAIWRRCAARRFDNKKQGHSAKYDAEKILFYAQVIKRIQENEGGQVTWEADGITDAFLKDPRFRAREVCSSDEFFDAMEKQSYYD